MAGKMLGRRRTILESRRRGLGVTFGTRSYEVPLGVSAVTATSASRSTVVIPSDDLINHPVNTTVSVTRASGELAVIGRPGVLIANASESRDLAAGGTVTLTKTAANSWSLTGNVRTPLRTFYVDFQAGVDGNNGTSTSTPWKTLARVNSATLQAGDAVLFKRGSTGYTHDGNAQGALDISVSGTAANPIVIGAYGTGARPQIACNNAGWGQFAWGLNIRNYVIVQDLYLTGLAEYNIHALANCELRNVECNAGGNAFKLAGANSRIMGCYAHDLLMVQDSNLASDYGAVAFWVTQTDCEVGYSLAVNCRAPSTFFVNDGGFVEGEGCDRLYVHHNIARNCQGIFEAVASGGRDCDDTIFAYNLFESPHGGWLCPNTATGVRVENNTYVTRGESDGFRVFDGTPGSYSVRNNIFWTNIQVANSAPGVHTHNRYHPNNMVNGSGVGFTLGTGESTGDPLFVNYGGKDYRLSDGSPCLGAGTDLGYEVGTTPDLGAFGEVPVVQVTLWTAGHEAGTLAEWDLSGNGGEFNSGTGSDTAASTVVARTGTYSARQTIPGTSEAGTRMFRWGESRSERELFSEAWFYFPQAYTVSNWWWIWETKSSATGGTPNEATWAITVYNPGAGQMRGRVYWRGGLNGMQGPLSSSGTADQNYDFSPGTNFPIGQWFKLTTFLRQSKDFDGAFKVWLNDVQVFGMENVRTSYTSTTYNAWQCDNGLAWISYGNGISPAPVHYVDDARIYKEVASAGIAKIATVTEDFATLDSGIWTVSETGPTATGGVLSIPHSANYMAVNSVSSFDAVASSVHVKNVQHPTGASSESFFQLFDTTNVNNRANIVRSGPDFIVQLSGTNVTYLSAFDATQIYWRFTESGGTVTVATSANGSSWTNRSTFATPAWWSNVRIKLMGGYYSTAGTGTHQFDKVNLVG